MTREISLGGTSNAEWIARLTSHISERGAPNSSTTTAPTRMPIAGPPPDAPSEPPKSETAWLKERRKSWARLIRRVYEADPLLCRSGQRMCVVGFVTQVLVILSPAQWANVSLPS